MSNSTSSNGTAQPDTSMWKEIVARYQKPCVGRATWQIVNTIVPFIGLWVAMYFTRNISWWLTIPLAVLAGGLTVRTFIIFHDCGHGSFFKSQTANHIVGTITGILTFTPYYHWRWEHAIHHSSSGDLDRRGMGDVWTLTVEEYLNSSRWRRFSYQLARNPFILFIIAPMILFLGINRVPKPKAPARERYSVHLTTLAVGLMSAGLIAAFGLKAFLIIQLTILAVAGSAGVWLFYVQHQYEGVYWERSEKWDYVSAALHGSSFYKLPKILQWFSGNIGFHHIHHLSARIPNYNLERCHKAEPLFQTVKPITLISSLKSFTFRLWDEQHRRLVGYGYLRTLRRQQQMQQ
jgi:acyl-lipid omega-6 desaturase (Delta-12 desaturase)